MIITSVDRKAEIYIEIYKSKTPNGKVYGFAKNIYGQFGLVIETY